MMKFDALSSNMTHNHDAGILPRISILLVALVALVAGCQQMPAQGVERGEVLFDNCSACHGVDGLGRVELAAPAIAGLDSWYVENQLTGFQAGHRGAHPEDSGGLRMRPLSLTMRSEDDIKAISEYVASMPTAKPRPTLKGGDPGRGALYYKPCEACHGANGEGQQALNAPSLNHSQDWYLFKQLQHFKKGIRGTREGDVYGAQMSAMITSLPDEQAMLDVVAYIQKLK